MDIHNIDQFYVETHITFIMQKIIITIFLISSICEGFFVNTRDWRRIFSFLPKDDDSFRGDSIKSHPNPHRIPYKYPRDEPKHPNYYNVDPAGYQYYDRNDREEYNQQNPNYHRQPIYQDTKKYYDDRRTEDIHKCPHHKETYPYDYFKIQSRKRDERQEENSEHNENTDKDNQEYLKHKKDYVTGVLLTIPNIKYSGDLESYYSENKQNNPFLQPLKKKYDESSKKLFESEPSDDNDFKLF